MVEQSLIAFKAKFEYFKRKVAKMDQLFEVSFTPLRESGRALSRCGLCKRYMKLIETSPPRLFCAFCNQSYMLPSNGQLFFLVSQLNVVIMIFRDHKAVWGEEMSFGWV